MKTPDGLLTQNAYAKKIGVAVSAVQKAIASGKIDKALVTHGNKKLINESIANKLWAEQQSVHPHAATAKINQVASQDADAKNSPSSLDTQDADQYKKSRSVREAYMARLAKVEYEERIGKLVPADDVRLAAFHTARIIRDSITSIPDRLAPILAHISDEFQVHQLLREELEKSLEELSQSVKFLDTPTTTN